MCSKDVIRTAISCAVKGKTKRHDVQYVLKNIDKCVDIVYDILTKETFEPTPYKVSQRYDYRNKKIRIIQRPKFFPDQIIHWIIVIVMQPIIMRGMYHWSCGSIPNRGIKHGQDAVKKWLKNDKKNTKYCLKLDIRHFYDNIPHDKLKKLITSKIKDKKAIRLMFKVIDTTETGIPIGNYTSQWFANFYLEKLDHYIKEKLSTKYQSKYYIRYIDDLVLFGNNKKKLRKLKEELFKYIEEELGLEVKNNWQIFLVKSRGVDFLGLVFFHGYTKLRDRNFLSLTRQSRKIKKRMKRHQKIPYSMAAGFLSRIGQLKYCDSCNIRRKYLKGIKMKYLKDVIRSESKRKLCAQNL